MDKLGLAINLIIAYLFFQIGGPSIPVLWAALGVFVFGLIAFIFILMSPVLYHRAIMSIQKETDEYRKERLKLLDIEVKQKDERIDKLQAQLIDQQRRYLELKKISDDLENRYNLASDRLMKYEGRTDDTDYFDS